MLTSIGGGPALDANAQDRHNESQSLLPKFSNKTPQCRQNRSPNRNKSANPAAAEFSTLNGSSPRQSQEDGLDEEQLREVSIEVPTANSVAPQFSLRTQMPPKIQHPLDESPGGQVVRLAAYYAVGFLLSFPVILFACVALFVAFVFRFVWHCLRTRSFAQFHFFPVDCDWSSLRDNGRSPDGDPNCIQQCVITLQGDFPLTDVRQLLWRRLVNAKSENARLHYPKYCRNSKISSCAITQKRCVV